MLKVLMRALRYFFDEALLSLWRGRRSGILAVATITTALFVLGGFLLVTSNLERLLARWGSAAEFSIYLRESISETEREAIDRILGESRLVAGREDTSKAEALRRFKTDFADLADAATGLSENPFPASIEVRLRPETASSGDAVDRLARALRQTSGVADVRYDRNWIERLLQALGLVRGLGFTLAALLVVAAALTVANVVRLALHARRDEIQIMQLVGAPLAYIRGPFVLEGILQGGMGALTALILLWLGYLAGRARYGAALSSLVDPASLGFLPPVACVLLLAGGMAVGCVGGLVAARSVSS